LAYDSIFLTFQTTAVVDQTTRTWLRCRPHYPGDLSVVPITPVDRFAADLPVHGDIECTGSEANCE